MKKFIIITATVLGIILVVGVTIGLIRLRTAPSTPQGNGNPFGFASNTPSILPGKEPTVIQLKDGSTVDAPAFVLATQPEWANAQNGLAVTPESTESFGILFYPNNSGFLISLLSEPLGATRSAAEKYLQTKLQLNKNQLCQLKVQVFTSIEVSETYAGQDLGLSFCPGAVVLP